jgi:hypothetical protein
MRWRPLVLMATCGFVVLLWANPATAKGPDQATITGPGLDEPIVVSGYGKPGTGSELGELADGSGLFLVMFEPDDRRVVSEAPDGPLGPRYELSFRVPDGIGTGSTVRQELYPRAPGGPVTYTEAGQTVFGMTTRGGWYRTPTSFTPLLERLGVSAAASGQPLAGPVAMPEPVDLVTAPPSGLPIAVTIVAAAVAVIAGVAFGWWRVTARRPRALPRRHAVGQPGSSTG